MSCIFTKTVEFVAALACMDARFKVAKAVFQWMVIRKTPKEQDLKSLSRGHCSSWFEEESYSRSIS